MKKCYELLLLTGVCSALNLGCSKNEAVIDTALETISVAAVERNPRTYSVPFDYIPPKGVEPQIVLGYPFKEPDYEFPPKMPFTIISSPTTAYIKATCPFDISALVVGSIYHQIKDENLQMAFFVDEEFSATVRRLKPNIPLPNGWNAAWNTQPNVEKENPEVLFSTPGRELVVVLSKPCVEFGFEMTPDNQNRDYKFDVYFGNSKFDGASGYISQRVRTPSGAKLFAVKAKKPFQIITIFYDIESSSNVTYNMDGVALANLRFKLYKP